MTVELPEDLPRVTADARRIAQVLNNLLANTARHSPESAPIRVEARRNGAEVEVSVVDRGAGIPAARLPHLFRRHAGVGPGGEDGDRGGSGLGLVICRGLVEAHGGRIRAESAGPGRGTRILFTLPAAEEAGASVPAAPPRDAADRTPVLVVDDDPHALRQARDALATAGYAPAATAEPGAIPRLVETGRPALVVLDLVLPGVDGIELMRTLPALADLPVIFVSAYGGGDTIARALEAGAADYIVKPYSPAELAARVSLALRRRTAPRHVPHRRPGDRPRQAPGDAGRAHAAAHRDRVPAAGRGLARRRRGELLRGPATPGVGPGQGRCAGGQEYRHQAPPQARR